MKHFEISGTVRQLGNKTAIKNFRRQGLVPCNLYGPATKENVIFTVSAKDLKNITHTPNAYIIDLVLDNGLKQTAIVKELQFHPVTDETIHVDFLSVTEDKPITIDVPVVVSGHPVGVQRGGKFIQRERRLKVCALMKDLPDTVDIDVSGLDLEKRVLAGDLSFDNFKVVSRKDTIICTVKSGRNVIAAAAEE